MSALAGGVALVVIGYGMARLLINYYDRRP